MKDLQVVSLSPSPVQLDKAVNALVAGLNSRHTRRAYRRGIADFLTWYREQGQPELNKALINSYKGHLLSAGVGASSVNQRLTAIRKMAQEASDNGWLNPVLAQGVARVQGVKATGTRAGNWLTLKQANSLIQKPDTSTLKGLRDRAILVVLLGAGLRRSELAALTFEQIRTLDHRWVLADLMGKGGRVRSIPISPTVKNAVDAWVEGAGIAQGYVFRSMQKGGRVNDKPLRPRWVNEIVQEYAPDLAAHDLRRTFAKLAWKAGSDITQIQIVLGHESLETTRRYLGVELDLTNSPSDHIRLRL